MPGYVSVDAFLRSLDERYTHFKKCMDALIQAIASPNIKQRGPAAEQAFQAGTDLARSLSSHDQPAWLLPIITALRDHKDDLSNEAHCFRLSKAVAKYHDQIHNHKWSFRDEPQREGIHFDHIYERCRDSTRVSELFDTLIDQLEKIIESNEIDSIRVVTALRKLAATLSRNRKGSYFSTMASWDFVISVCRKWLWIELEKLPPIGGLLTAFRQTLDETDKEINDLHAAMQREVATQVGAELKVLAYQQRELPSPPKIPQIENGADPSSLQEP